MEVPGTDRIQALSPLVSARAAEGSLRDEERTRDSATRRGSSGVPASGEPTEKPKGHESHPVDVAGGHILRFQLSEDGVAIAQVLDASTNEVVREVPTEELRELASRLDELTGVFVDRSL